MYPYNKETRDACEENRQESAHPAQGDRREAPGDGLFRSQPARRNDRAETRRHRDRETARSRAAENEGAQADGKRRRFRDPLGAEALGARGPRYERSDLRPAFHRRPFRISPTVAKRRDHGAALARDPRRVPAGVELSSISVDGGRDSRAGRGGAASVHRGGQPEKTSARQPPRPFRRYISRVRGRWKG